MAVRGRSSSGLCGSWRPSKADPVGVTCGCHAAAAHAPRCELSAAGLALLYSYQLPLTTYRWVMSRPCAVPTRPGLSFTPQLASHDDTTRA